MVKYKQLNKEHKFILENKEGNSVLDYFRIYCFKGQKPFETDEKKIISAFKLLDNHKKELKSKEPKVLKRIFLELRALDGVGFAVASAILYFKFPDQFAIIDRNALSGISKEDSSFVDKKITNNSKKLDQDIALYLRYLKYLGEKIPEKGKTLREVEYYYFKKGKEK